MVYTEDPEKWDFLPELALIYEQLTPEEMKTSKVPSMPWIRFFTIIDKLYELMEELESFGAPKPGVLETVMVNWLKDVAPEKVLPKYIRAIHEFACAIGDKVGEVKHASFV